ncbi:hypothetical protein [Pseudaquabacterium rugosum]|uniref:Uncharacterized protein n=1 Tax=Pseudaquabacterium rugosum TaxID=2984194 RepID=A0ABU9BHJ5_9BURK
MNGTTPSPTAASEPDTASPTEKLLKLPIIERYTSHYARYNGSIGRKGENQTTHTAEIRFPGHTQLAVVKAFPLKNKGWVNEALAWTLGMELDIGVPPAAILLAASPSDLANATEPELVFARNQWGADGPIVFWCASRLDLKPPNQVWRINWEHAVTSKPAGQRLAAFDAWMGNCDRISDNAPYWSARGRIAAIDHEKLAFNQDWVHSAPAHLDRSGFIATHLTQKIREAISKKKMRVAEAKVLIAALAKISAEHSAALAAVRGSSEELVSKNFGTPAANNLHTFLFERASQEFIDERLEQLR